MKRILDLIGMSAGGWLGWAAAPGDSIFAAFVAGVIGTAVGLYAVRRFTRGLLP